MLLLKHINKINISLFVGFLFFIIFCLNLNSFIGNKLLFFIFNLFSYFLFLMIIKKNLSSFEFFFYSLLLLGLWFRLSCVLLFDGVTFMEGDINNLLKLPIDNTMENKLIYVYNKTIFIIIITYSACIVASFIRQYFFDSFFNIKKGYEMRKNFIYYYSNYRFLILLLFIIMLISLWVTNFYFKIHIKGLINSDVPKIVKYFFSWSFTYGFSVITTILIYVDYLIKKQKIIFIIGAFEAFFTQLSMFSRAFILTFIAYLRGIYIVLDSPIRNYFTTSKILKIFALAILLMTISYSIVFNLRTQNFLNENSYNFEPIKIVNEFAYVATHRWVGIDSLMSVVMSEKTGFKLFSSSLSEKINHREASFYMKNFFTSFRFEKDSNSKLNTVILPGIVAYLLYADSLMFLFFSVIFLILLSTSIEMLFLKLSRGNAILSSIIGYALAMRLIHFGYIPLNTIPYLISFIITLLFVALISKIIWKN